MSNVAVLITSCDAFADCWPPALACLEKYWPDCPWPVLTLSNHEPWGACPFLVGDDKGWVANLLTVLDSFSELEFVLVWLEDMLLCRPVDTFACREALRALRFIHNCGGIRLGQGAEITSHETLVGSYKVVSPESPYRVSTSPTLWRVSYLRKILAGCRQTAADFELDGTNVARELPQEIWVQAGPVGGSPVDAHRAFRQYYTAITAGRWNRGCLNWLAEIGIDQPDLSRGVIENV